MTSSSLFTRSGTDLGYLRSRPRQKRAHKPLICETQETPWEAEETSQGKEDSEERVIILRSLVCVIPVDASIPLPFLFVFFL